MTAATAREGRVVMPGSGLMALNMVGKEASLVDSFFDSEEDEVPVDMEIVFEAMKHVPLPDIDYPEQDDSVSGEPSISEALPGRAIRLHTDPVVRQGMLKRKGATEEAMQPKRKGGGTSRVPKRVKVELRSNGICGKTVQKQAPKVEIVVGSVNAAAAKVAAEVAPNVVTGGTVAETGPRPDFSLWTVEDDLLLKDAMEAGAAMEALAKGAMRFSRRFTVRELRERWRALLYDPEIADQAALRMAEAEYANNYCRPKSPVEQKNPQELVRKRRANSIRTLYYKRSKNLALEDVALDSADDLIGRNGDGACGSSAGLAMDNPQASDIRALSDVTATESVGPSSMPLKEGHSLELEDGTFSQMYSLLATGGIKAVIAAIPAGMSVNAPEQGVGGSVGVPQNGGEDLLPSSGLSKLVGSKEDPTVLQAENGQHSGSGSVFGGHMEKTCSLVVNGAATASESSSAGLRHSCASVEDGSAFTIADIRVDVTLPSSNCSQIPLEDAQRDVAFAKDEGCELACAQAGNPVQQMNDAREAEKGDHTLGLCPVSLQVSDGKQNLLGDFSHLDNRLIGGVNKLETSVADAEKGDHTLGLCPVSLQVSDGKQNLLGDFSHLDNRLIGGVNKLETSVADGTSVNLSEVKDVEPCGIGLVSAVDHREDFNADTKVLSQSVGRIDGSSSGQSGSTDLLERCHSLTMDARAKDEMDEAETIEALYRECCCGEYCRDDNQEESGHRDICYCTGADEAHDCHSSYVLTGEPCTGDLDCPYLTYSSNLQQNKLEQGIIQSSVCTLNTEDTEVPSLEDSLLPPLSPFSSPSDQGDMVDYADSPDADGSRDDYIYADEIIGGIPSGDEEYMDISARIEPEVNNIRDTSPALFGSSVDRSVGSTGVHPSNGIDPAGVSLPAVEDEKMGPKCPGQGTSAGICKISTSASDLEGPYTPTPSQNLHQQVAPQENGDGRCQDANNLGVTDWQASTFLPVIGDREAETSPNPDSLVLPATGARDGAALKSVQDPAEEEVESDEDMARFSDIEAMVLDMDLDVADDEFSARAESKRLYRRHGRAVVRSEQAATAAMQRELRFHGALAILYGRHSKHYIRETEELMGRGTMDNFVNIDLGKEGRANKVSRQQAKIKLKKDGVFYLHNLGRRGLTVNNKSIEKGERAILGSNCLIEVGGMRFIFEINKKLVQEHISRGPQP